MSRVEKTNERAEETERAARRLAAKFSIAGTISKQAHELTSKHNFSTAVQSSSLDISITNPSGAARSQLPVTNLLGGATMPRPWKFGPVGALASRTLQLPKHFRKTLQ